METWLAFNPPGAPSLSADELESAVAAGGAEGIALAIIAKLGLDGAARSDLTAAVCRNPLVQAATRQLSDYRGGRAIPHADALAPLVPAAHAAAIVDATILHAGLWLAHNPGRIEARVGAHHAGHRRVFD